MKLWRVSHHLFSFSYPCRHNPDMKCGIAGRLVPPLRCTMGTVNPGRPPLAQPKYP
jgi:hypothetical protein